MRSHERRLARFMANGRIEVHETWNQFIHQVLPFWRNKHLRSVLDLTPCNDEAVIIYVGLLVHARLLPVACCRMPAQGKWQERQWSIVERLLDKGAPYVGEAHCTFINL